MDAILHRIFLEKQVLFEKNIKIQEFVCFQIKKRKQNSLRFNLNCNFTVTYAAAAPETTSIISLVIAA